MAALGDREIVALLHLAQRRGVIQPERVDAVGGLIDWLDGAERGVRDVLRSVLALADADDDRSGDLLALIDRCRDDPETIAHARSLLDMAVRAQPPERRRRRRSAPEGAADA